VALVTWSRVFPATPERVGEARRFLTEIMSGSPATADAVLCLSELVSNAILHSRSAQPGGQFTVRASTGVGHIRVEVEDEGGAWERRPGAAGARSDPDEHGGRGLAIVAELASSWGIAGDGTGGRSVWYELSFPGRAEDSVPLRTPERMSNQPGRLGNPAR
jgi:anti-sigma regulatory factor (Ser/Thr protein kinase)